MQRQIEIGEFTDKEKRCMITFHFESYPETSSFITHNSNLFMCREIFTGIGILIKKNTEQGKDLLDMMRQRKSIEEIQLFLLEICLPHIDANMLIDIFKKIAEDNFKRGINHNRRQFKEVMGLK